MSLFTNEHVPGSCLTAAKQLVAFEGCFPGQAYILSRSGKCGIKIWVFYAQILIKISNNIVFHSPFIYSKYICTFDLTYTL